MLRALLLLGLALCATRTECAEAQDAKMQQAAIQAAKQVLISSFDSSLPRITLEYFLDYEAAGALVGWEAAECPLTPQVAGGVGGQVCVTATIQFRDGRVAMVCVAVETAGKDVPNGVRLRCVMITDQNGAVRKLRLIELPAAIRGPWRDIPRPKFSSDVPA